MGHSCLVGEALKVVLGVSHPSFPTLSCVCCRDTSLNNAQSLALANELQKEQLSSVQADLLRTKTRLEVS